MTDLVIADDRTPQVIAVEINMIKYQFEKAMLYSMIEIGRRLKEAKAKIGHGEWGKWLRESVSYSQKTAERFMRIAQAYGPKQLEDPDTSAKPQDLPNLTYSQALILLGVPEEERADFIAGLDIEGMTNQELTKAVNEKKEAVMERDQAKEEKDQAVEAGKQAVQERDQTQEKLEQAIKDNEDLKKQLDEKNNQINQLTTQNQGLEQQADAQETITELESQVKTAKAQAPLMTAEAKYAFYRDQLIQAFQNMKYALKELNGKDPETKEKHREEAYEMMNNLVKQIEVYPPIVTFTIL